MVDFAGWELPVQYHSLVAEHEAVRSDAGLFDVSHMGEIEFRGPGALDEVNRLISNNLEQCDDGQALYAGLLNDRGGFVDDVVVYRFSPERILLCVNASNRDKDFAWMTERSLRVRPVQRSDEFSQLALQGPKAAQILQALTRFDLSQLASYRFTETSLLGDGGSRLEVLLSRTGYTGEDGFELYCTPSQVEPLWHALLEEGAPHGLKPAGLGARDSLRTEAKFPLYGQDIDEEHSPLEAGLGFIVKLDKEPFVGREALVAQRSQGLERRWVGFELLEPGVPRFGYPVRTADAQGAVQLGTVTSGTFGPSIKRAIGMAYVPSSFATEGSSLLIEIRGRNVQARVVKTPFYRRKK
jgi:aminomethyltransferase